MPPNTLQNNSLFICFFSCLVVPTTVAESHLPLPPQGYVIALTIFL